MSAKILPIVLSYAASLLGFVTTLLIAKLLGAEDFGMVALGMAIGAFASPLLNLGTDRVFVRDFLHKDFSANPHTLAQRNFLARSSMTLLVVIALLGTAALTSASVWDWIALASFLVWAALLGAYPAAWYDAIGRVTEQNALTLGEKAVALVAAGAIYLGGNGLADAIVIGLVLLSTRLLFLGIQYAYWWRVAPRSSQQPQGHIGIVAGAGISARITGVVLANACVAYGNQVLLEVHGNRSELGAFGVAFQVISLVLLLQAQVLRLLARSIVLSVGRAELVIGSMLRHAGLLFAVSVPFSGVAWVVMNWLPDLLSDNSFAGIRQFALPLCAWAVIVGAGQVVTQYLVVVGAEQTYLRVAVLGAVASLGLGLVLVPHGGPGAVALILLAVHTAMIILQALGVNRAAKSCKKLTEAHD